MGQNNRIVAQAVALRKGAGGLINDPNIDAIIESVSRPRLRKPDANTVFAISELRWSSTFFANSPAIGDTTGSAGTEDSVTINMENKRQ